MCKKLTIEFVRGEFEKEGYILISTEYINSWTSLEYICPKGDEGVIRWNAWQQGQRCSECNGSKKHTIEFIREQFEVEGYILLTKKYTGAFQKLEYICPIGHNDSIKWNDWQQGHRCAGCAGVKKLTIEFILKEFEKEGYILLSREYTGCAQKLKYVCPVGHCWDITWNDWREGCRCQKCYFERNKGSGNYNYNPNLTDKERLNGRYIPRYDRWRRVVKERDNFTCQVCGDNRGGNLISHHLESYNNNPDLRTALSNGVCLCENCHKDFHHQYGRGNNTRKQFEKFKLNTGA